MQRRRAETGAVQDTAAAIDTPAATRPTAADRRESRQRQRLPRKGQEMPTDPAGWRRRDVLLVTGAGLAGCGSGAAAPAAARTWRMGFSPNPPRFTVQSVIEGIDRWSRRAELAIVHEEPPWAKLLAGQTPDAILDADKVELVRYLRGKGLGLVFMGDLTDGLDRTLEAPQLRAAGRSITEPAVQALYRDYLLAVDRRLQPSHLGLVAESNLIRTAAPAIYPAVVRAANDTAAALRAAGSTATLVASVQVEHAWGRLGGNGAFVGVAQDLADFPFTQVLGLSSYPYLGWPTPDDVPGDCFTRLVAGRSLPVMVTEGGWASASAGSIVSSPQRQARWVERQADLLDAAGAIAWLHLQFADIDLAAFPGPVPPNLPLFGSIGLATSDFTAKPSLGAWDALFARPRRG